MDLILGVRRMWVWGVVHHLRELVDLVEGWAFFLSAGVIPSDVLWRLTYHLIHQLIVIVDRRDLIVGILKLVIHQAPRTVGNEDLLFLIFIIIVFVFLAINCIVNVLILILYLLDIVSKDVLHDLVLIVFGMLILRAAKSG